MLQVFAVAKYRHVKTAGKKWNREFIHSQEQGVFRLLNRMEVKIEKHEITIMTHEETGISVNYVGNDVNESKLQIALSKKVADHLSESIKRLKNDS
jgi:hypothetical protein